MYRRLWQRRHHKHRRMDACPLGIHINLQRSRRVIRLIQAILPVTFPSAELDGPRQLVPRWIHKCRNERWCEVDLFERAF